MLFLRIRSLAGFRCYWKLGAWLRKARHAAEARLAPTELPGALPGICHVCGAPRQFRITGRHWRETLLCPKCRLWNRVRAAAHFLDAKVKPGREASIYITEQKTSLYKALKEHYPNLEGSEYLGAECPAGGRNREGIRNESLTGLTFADGSLDCILCLEVLEHIPRYEQALRECARTLRPGGALVFTVPFMLGTQATLIRAREDEAGNILHIEPPEYHGDPLKTEGCLCFYHFGWDLLDRLRELGFRGGGAYLYWSRKYGYLGEPQAVFMARKG